MKRISVLSLGQDGRQCIKSLLRFFPAAISEASTEGKRIPECFHWSIYILILSPFATGTSAGR